MAHYFDTLLNIAVTGPVVRLEFGMATQVKGDGGKDTVRVVPADTVIMPIDGFARAFGLQEQAIQQLVKSGVLRPRESNEASQPAA